MPLIQDFILFTVNPHDPKKSPFRDLRQVIPVRLTTDTCSGNGAGVGILPAFEYSVPSSPGDTDDHGSSANGHDERLSTRQRFAYMSPQTYPQSGAVVL